MSSGWLVAQLPAVIAADDFTRRFLGIFEEIGDGLRDRIDGIEYLLDPGLAPPEFVRWLGGWLGLVVPTGVDSSRQRALVDAVGPYWARGDAEGPLWGWRGTKRGLVALLEAYVGHPVTVEDSGGVYGADEAPRGPARVLVRVPDAGGVHDQQLLALVRSMVPVEAEIDLFIAERHVEEDLDRVHSQ